MIDGTTLTYLIVFAALIVSAPLALKSNLLYRRRGRFKCTMCGNCCRLRIINLTKEDVKVLESAGKKGFAEPEGEPRLKRVNGKCVFLKDDRCSIHGIRPQVCRDFPFFRTWGIGYAREASFCPAMDNLQNEGRNQDAR
jgi:Fe-S-cluster containining protein